MLPVIAAAAAIWLAAALALGHIAHPRRINATTPGTAQQDRAAIEENDMPARPAHFPALAVACPTCQSPAGQLCTSHSGTRERRHDVHQVRTAAFAAQTRSTR